jgi:hypothetical protein
MLAKRYAEIESATQRLLKVLGQPGKSHSEPNRIDRLVHSELGLELTGGVPSLEALSGFRVQERIGDLELLRRCATSLRKKSHSVEPTVPPSKRHSGDVP